MRWIALVAVLSSAACATAPLAPSIMVLPARGVPLEQFQADDAGCRDWAVRQSSGDQRQYDIAYQQCMYAKGHVIPGVPPPQRGSGTTTGPTVLR